MVSLLGLVIRVMVVSQNEFGSVPSSEVFEIVSEGWVLTLL